MIKPMTEQEPQLPDQEIFTLTDVNHELTNKFQPEFVARGGEHVVYNIQDHPDIVAKASVDTITSLITENMANNNPPDYMGGSEMRRAEVFLQEEDRRYKQLRESFGKEHTLAQKKYRLKVPVTPQILDEIFEGHSPAIITEAWAVVAIQKRSKALKDLDHLSVIAGYSEMEEVNPDEYIKQTDQLFIHPEGDGFDLEEFKRVQSKKELHDILDQVATDDRLKETLKDFVLRSIEYTLQTGETLDLAGTDNVAVYKQDGKWSHELLDALYPGNNAMVEATQAGIIKLTNGQEPTRSEMSSIMNSINYVRTINGLAKYLGIQQRIDIVPQEATGATIDYLGEIKKHLAK